MLLAFEIMFRDAVDSNGNSTSVMKKKKTTSVFENTSRKDSKRFIIRIPLFHISTTCNDVVGVIGV